MTMSVLSSDTVFAVSSGRGRAAVAVIRVSGPHAFAALAALGVSGLSPRQAHVRRLRDPENAELLDEALVLAFPAPNSATGEDLAELHVHGGRAVVAAVLDALSRRPGLIPAEPGAFARRAFANGKLDLTSAEGLADLIDAETELQRRQAVRQSSGEQTRLYQGWRAPLLEAMALVEAAIDFSDEGDVASDAIAQGVRRAAVLRAALDDHLGRATRAEIVRNGFRVVLAGAPNAGKSSLLNALAGRDAAIVSDEPGTTRDAIDVRLDLGGAAVVFTDTAGLRDTESAVEQEGIRRTRMRMDEAELVVWLVDGTDAGNTGAADVQARPPEGVIRVITKADIAPERLRAASPPATFVISSVTGSGIDALVAEITTRAHARVGDDDDPAPVNQRQRQLIARALGHLDAALALAQGRAGSDVLPELLAEELRLAANTLGELTGHVDPEQVLDVVFGRFCIGK